MLLETPAAVRFVKAEPLLGEIDFEEARYESEENILYYNFLKNITVGQVKTSAGYYNIWDNDDIKEFGVNYPLDKKGIDWVIVGGESGANARPIHPNWVRSIQQQCEKSKTAFFFKKWGEFIPREEMIKQHGYKCRCNNFNPIDKCSSSNESDCLKILNYNFENEEWGCVDIKGNYNSYTTTFNGRELDPRDEYETTVYRLGKKKAGSLLGNKEYKEYSNIKNILE